MALDMRQVLVALALAAPLIAACAAEDDPQPRSDGVITIPNLTGLSRAHAIGLIDNLDLTIRVEKVDIGQIASATPSPGVVAAGRFAREDVVIKQDPPPDTRVERGTTVTLFVPHPRALRPGESNFRLLTHCGLSYPLEVDNGFWLPVDRKLRRTINPPQGFASDGYYDKGTIRRIDEDTLIYTSSTGIMVEYEPTSKRPGGCE
jgi:PASTA domain-containing protein